MELLELLEILNAKNIFLKASGDKLSVMCEENSLTPELRNEIKYHKQVLIDYLEKGKKDDTLVSFQNEGTKRTIFAFGGIGGTVSEYKPLSIELGRDQNFFTFENLNHEFNNLTDLVHQNIKEMKTIQPVGPYRLMGFSFGGTVAYEMSRLLQKEGERVESIILLDSLSPYYANIYEDKSNLYTMVYEFSEKIFAAYNVEATFTLEELKCIPKWKLTKYLSNKFKMFLSDDDLTYYKTIAKSYYRHLKYQKQYKMLPLTDKIEHTLLIRGYEFENVPNDYGWNNYCNENISISYIKNDHLNFLAENNNLKKIAMIISDFYSKIEK